MYESAIKCTFNYYFEHNYLWFGKTKINKSQHMFEMINMCMLLLLLSRFSPVRLCATPYTAAHQAPLSLGFSRQDHWSGFPFPSPMHERLKWKWSRSVESDSYQPHGLQPTRLLHPWDVPGKSIGVGCHCLLQNMCILIVIKSVELTVSYFYIIWIHIFQIYLILRSKWQRLWENKL